MGSGTIGFSQTGDAAQPSPSIWGDCPNTLLQDKGLGYFKHAEFLAAVTDTLAASEQRPAYDGALNIVCDDDTVVTQKAAEVGGYLDIETDGDDNDGAALFSEPIGTITRNSGKKVWFEARIELGAVADQGVFVGLVEEAGATQDVIADNCGALIGESYIGFRQLADDTDAFDAAYKKDAGTEVVVKSDATNATAIPSADRASVAANTEIKLGVYFNGRDQIGFYVNGVKVATQEVDSTIDQTKNYCACVAVKTGTAAAQSIAVDWVRYGSQLRT